MFILQVPPLSIILKLQQQQKKTAGKTLYRTLSLAIYCGRLLFFFTEIWGKKQEDLITFLKVQDVRHSSSECPPALNQNAPLIIAPTIERRKLNEKVIIFNGYIYTQGISAISTINAPKGPQSAVNCGNMALSKICNVLELGHSFRLNLANYNRNN